MDEMTGAQARSLADGDGSLIERIADAVVRKLDEREKIRILADAVLERMRELDHAHATAPAEGDTQCRSVNPPASTETEGGV